MSDPTHPLSDTGLLVDSVISSHSYPEYAKTLAYSYPEYAKTLMPRHWLHCGDILVSLFLPGRRE